MLSILIRRTIGEVCCQQVMLGSSDASVWKRVNKLKRPRRNAGAFFLTDNFARCVNVQLDHQVSAADVESLSGDVCGSVGC